MIHGRDVRVPGRRRGGVGVRRCSGDALVAEIGGIAGSQYPSALVVRCSAGLGAVVQHGGRHGAMRRGRSPNKGRCCIVAFCEEDSEVKP